MSDQEIAILLTCQTLEDFPVSHEGEDAESLLASWTALWHPRLLACSGKLPQWFCVDALPEAKSGRLLIVPRPSQGSVQPRLAAEWEAQGVVQIYGETDRAQILKQALQHVEPTESAETVLADDFMAFGFAYLQVRLLTRRMRYTPTLEESVLQANIVAGARAAVAGDEATARQQLQACFDLLSQERNHYYAVDVFLIDLSLFSDRLPDTNLSQQLVEHPKTSLLMTAEAIERLAARSPDLPKQLQAALEAKTASLVGGEYRDLPLPLLSTETLRGQLQRGSRVYQQVLQQQPRVFGRHRFGLTPSIPQLLVARGYRAALHATFDGGQFPEATQSKSRWEGDAQTSIDSIIRSPLDASRPETFLNLAGKLSESMDMDHVATRCFVHWAGASSRWYADLIRVTHYTNALGRFVTLDEYFDQTYDPGLHDRFGPDQYHTPYLQQSVAAGEERPISSYPRYWRRWGLVQSLWHCASLNVLLDDGATARAVWQEASDWAEQFAATALDDDDWEGRESQIRQRLHEVARKMVGKMAGATSGAGRGIAVVNPSSFPRRTLLDGPSLETPPVEASPVYAAELTRKRKRLVVDIPSMGAAWLTDQGKRPGRRRAAPPLAEALMLRNEFLEVHLDPATGGLRVLRDYQARGNRMSQQLIYRRDDAQSRRASSDDQADTCHSSMVADRCEVTQADSIVGEIVTRGRLQDSGGASLADFRQTFRLLRGSRVLELEIDLQPRVDLRANPWQSYFASRFAWASEAADLQRSYHELRCPTKARRLEAPLFIQVDDGAQKTTVLTGGLPFHRRVGPRMLDTLLIVQGEIQREFHLGIGLDLKQPAREALGLLLPTIVIDDLTGLSNTQSAWLVHLNARNALVTGCEPRWEQDRVVGIRFHVAEIDGKSTSVGLRAFRPIRSARKIDAHDQTVSPCDVSEDEVRFALAAHELTVIEASFTDSP